MLLGEFGTGDKGIPGLAHAPESQEGLHRQPQEDFDNELEQKHVCDLWLEN